MPHVNQPRTPRAHLEAAASELLKEGKKRANEFYTESLSKKEEIEEEVRDRTDRLAKKIQENPLTSVLIAGGIGYLISRLMRK